MENKFTREVIALIDEYFNQEKISIQDLETIIEHCLGYLVEKNFSLNVFSKNFELNDLFDDGEVPDGDKYTQKFNAEKTLRGYKTIREVSKQDLEIYIKNSQDMDVFFGDNKGRLEILIGKNNSSFDNSPIKKIFDDYSINSNPEGHPCPRKIMVPLADIKEVYGYLEKSALAKAHFEMAVSLSSQEEKYKGRVIVILVCDTGNKTIKYYDTFKLCPPDGGC
jgi:hypothetical protein